MRLICWSAAVLAILALPSNQSYAALVWSTEPAPGARVNLKLTNLEEIVDTDGTMAGSFPGKDGFAFPDSPGDELRGIFKITTIEDAGTLATLWSDGFLGQEITGFFMSYLVKSIVPGAITTVDFTGGVAKMFIGSSTAADKFTASYSVSGAGPIPHGDGYSDGEFWLDLVGIGGVIAGDLTVTLDSTFTSTTSPVAGHGIGHFDITGGSGASLFKADALDPAGPGGTLGMQDLQFLSDVSGGLAGWPAKSSDPVTGEIVPEASSFTIWGLLALGAVVGGASRRRRKK